MKGLDPLVLQEVLKGYLLEDLGHGDITTCHLPKRDKWVSAVVKTKAPGAVAGLILLASLFHILDPTVQVELLIKEGEMVKGEIR